jgi:hypothetical protein
MGVFKVAGETSMKNVVLFEIYLLVVFSTSGGRGVIEKNHVRGCLQDPVYKSKLFHKFPKSKFGIFETLPYLKGWA